MKSKIVLNNIASLFLGLLIMSSLAAQENESVKWMSFEEAVEMNKKNKKKILVDVYTNWCGWCKKMEATTYKDPAIVAYLNENYYSVKLNAERKDTVRLGDQIFINRNPDARRSAHDLAISLLNGKMGYPSTVFLDENIQLLNPPISGYMTASSLEPILHFFGDNVHSSKTVSWEDYKKNFKGNAK